MAAGGAGSSSSWTFTRGPSGYLWSLDDSFWVLVLKLSPNLSHHKLPQVDSSNSSQNPPNLKLREIMFSKKQKPAWPQKLPSAIVTVQNKLTIVYVKYLQSKVHLFQSDHPRWLFGKKHDYPTLVLCFFIPPPQNPPIYGSVRFKTIGTLLDWTPFNPFSFSHQSCWKITSRKTIPDLKRYLFAMKFIFKHLFGHFLKMNEKVKLPFSRPKEKNTFLFCENLNVLYFYISNIMPPLMLVLLASPPQTQFVATFSQ